MRITFGKVVAGLIILAMVVAYREIIPVLEAWFSDPLPEVSW